jgi:carbohydrate-binding DOMON domain-containing protein
MATSTVTLTPSPTATSTLTPSATPIPTQILPSATPVFVTPIPEKTPEPSRSSFPLWQVLGLLGLFLVVASASVVDPRPKALGRLGETFRVMSAEAKDDSFDNKQN